MKPGLIFGAVGVISLGLFASTWWRTAAAQQPLTFTPRDLRVVGVFDPRDAMILRSEDGAFTVPQGKLFVLTGIGEQGTTPGTVHWFQHVTLYLNGEAVIMRAGNYQETSTLQCSITEVPQGFTGRAGDTILVSASGGLGGNARAWGYLIDD